MRILGRLTWAILLLAGLWSVAGAQQVWIVRNPLTQTKTINAVTWTGTQFVAVGVDGVTLASTDGLTWENKTSSSMTTTLYAVTWANNRLFAVGGGGVVLTSTNNGTSWTNVNTGSPNPLYGISSLGGRIVVVGGGNTILYSDNNGTTWTSATSPLTGSTAFVGISASSTKLVAVSGANAVQSTDGSNWTAVSTGNGGLTAVTWAVNQFVVTGHYAGTSSIPATGTIRTSIDGGAPWMNRTSNTSAVLTAAAFGAQSQIVAVGAGGVIRYSPNGENWSTAVSPTTINLNGVASSNNRFVAVGVNGIMLASNDGVNWMQTSSVSYGLNSMATRISSTTPPETLNVIVGATGSVLTSTNGTAWTKQNFPNINELKGVAAAGTNFVAVAAREAYISPDGVSWTLRTVPTNSNINGVAANGTTAVAVAENGEIFVSTNSGQTWIPPTTPNAESGLHLTSVAYGGSPTPYWVAVGHWGTVRRAAGTNPGGTWSAMGLPTTAAPTSERMDAITWVGAPHNLFVAVGAKGLVYTSPNAASGNWTQRITGFTTNLYSITYANGQFVATGPGGHVITSSNLDTWTKPAPMTNNGLYNVKWDGRLFIATGAGGTILTSSPAAVPPVPTPAYPTAGTLNVPIHSTFAWSSSSGAVSYRVQVSASSTFSSFLLDSTQAESKGTSLTFGPLSPSTPYYWRVNAIGGTGMSDFSATQNFTVTAAAGSSPTLDEPAANATDVLLSTALKWIGYPGAVSYRVQVSTDSMFNNPSALFAENLALVGTSMLLNNLQPNTKYFWRVSARLSTGITGWTLRRFWTTPPAPTAAPTLTSPAEGAIAVSRTAAVLSWSTVSGASFYQVQVSTNSNFSSFFLDTNVVGGSSTSVTLSGLAENGVYYWRVRGRNAAGAGDYSVTRMFTTATASPAAPVLTSPTPGQTGVDVFPTFTWNASSGTVTYRLQVATDSLFNARVVDSVLAGTSVTLKLQLSNLTIYHWRVSATNPAGTTTSARRAFFTGTAPTVPPSAPELESPAQFTSDVNPAGINLTWKTTANARGYVLQVSTSFENFDAQRIVSDTLTGLSKALTSLTGSTAYFWRVKAYNHLGFGPASEVWNFNTRTTLPPAPALVSPEQYATGISLTPTRFVWRKAFAATSYVLQVSTSATFTSYVLNTAGIADTGFSVTSLSPNTDYYWRVLSRNTAGTGDPSGTRYFKTGVLPLPGPVTLIAPASFATGVAINPVLTWGAAENATTYHLQVSGNQNFSSFLFQDSTLTGLTRTLSALPQSANIYWRVRAKNASGASDWAARLFITTGPDGIVPGQVAFQRMTSSNGQVLRFGLWRKDLVRIRFFDTQGREVAARIEETMNPGYHTLVLPELLRGSFFLLDFQAGDYHKTVKIHPGK